MKLKLTRLYQTPINNPKQTEGELYVIDNDQIIYECKTLELPWRENQRRVSCIPSGNYKAVKHISPKFGRTFWIKDVPNRSEILIHSGNYNSHTLGCPLVGQTLTDINGDGLRDVTNSRFTMNELLELLPSEFEILVMWR